MDAQEKINTTSHILALGKALAPDRFPKPSREAGAAWAKALDKLFDLLPEDIWEEAVHLWAMELAGEKMITPRELKRAAYLVRDRWDADPVKREVLNAKRELNQQIRDQQIENGTFAQIRGYKQQKAEPLPNPKHDLKEILNRIGDHK